MRTAITDSVQRYFHPFRVANSGRLRRRSQGPKITSALELRNQAVAGLLAQGIGVPNLLTRSTRASGNPFRIGLTHPAPDIRDCGFARRPPSHKRSTHA
jgi:hypothetical protein